MNAPLTSGPRPAGEMSASDRARKPGAAVSAAATAPPSEWPTRWRRRDALFRERRGDRRRQRGERRFAGERRSAVAGQIESKRRIGCRQTTDQRPPAVEVRAETVNEDDRRACAAREPQAVEPRARADRRRRRGRRSARALVGLIRPGRRIVGRLWLRRRRRRRQQRAQLAGERLQVGIEGLVLADDPGDDCADRQPVASLGAQAAQHAARRRLDLSRGLVGLDLEQRLAFAHALAFGGEPAVELAHRHVQRDARQDDFDGH